MDAFVVKDNAQLTNASVLLKSDNAHLCFVPNAFSPPQINSISAQTKK